MQVDLAVGGFDFGWVYIWGFPKFLGFDRQQIKLFVPLV